MRMSTTMLYIFIAAAVAASGAKANLLCDYPAIPANCRANSPIELDGFCTRTMSNPRAYCASVTLDPANSSDCGTVDCHQDCGAAIDDEVCGEDSELWAIVCGAVFGGIMLFYCATKSCCSQKMTKLPTQSSTTYTHVIWVIWWAALIAVTQIATEQSGCMTMLSLISIGVGVLVFAVSGLALCCTCGLQPWGRKTPLQVPFPYDHAFRCSTMTTSCSLMSVIMVITTELIGKSVLLALVFAAVLAFHLTLVVAPENAALAKLKKEGIQTVLTGIPDPKLFYSGFSSFVSFHTTLAICIILDVLVGIFVDYLNTTAYNDLLERAEKEPSIECPSPVTLIHVPIGMYISAMMLANTMSFTNEIREFVEGRIAIALQRSGTQVVPASPAETKTLALYLRPTLAGIEPYMPLHMFTGFGSGIVGFFFVIGGILGIIDALDQDNDYTKWNLVQVYAFQILFGFIFVWHCHIISKLARATFPKAEDLAEHQGKMREIVADAKQSSAAVAEGQPLLALWTKVRNVVQTWTWQQAAALVVHAITLGSGVYAADMLKADLVFFGAVALGYALAIISAIGILFAAFTLSNVMCSNDTATGACCGCWLTVAVDESRRIATMNRSAVFVITTLLAIMLGLLCSCSVPDDDAREECSDDIQSARSFILFAWCLNLFLIMETVVNDNIHLVFDPLHIDLPYPRVFVALAMTSNVYCILASLIMVSSAPYFDSDTNECILSLSHLLGAGLTAAMVLETMFLNNEMNHYLRYAALKSRSSIAVDYFDKRHVLSAYTASGGVFAFLSRQSLVAFLVAAIVSALRSLELSFVLVPAVYEGILWVFFILSVGIQASITPGFLHPVVSSELIGKLGARPSTSVGTMHGVGAKTRPLAMPKVAGTTTNPTFDSKLNKGHQA